ncbi:AbrB family transcriptional regulator [Mameliella alba]|uniref:AbrB family transcriptional regulator n=1 Tax=Mameliella alba TaxID=561184 RepID=UPI000B533763|nr:AbrB family transcriptional regulator [Mameliella alba]MBY6122545.1 AbrB family transcriptional regulator [Mameliella alba]OWV39352.1 aminopeptidase [Mameliella alba]OWV52747.1 aminopeptidase [Mameliella alba]
MPDRPRTVTSRRIETALTAATGVALFTLLGLPLPFLFGPLAACLLAALAQRPLQGFGQVSKGFRTILGVAVGASLTPDVVAALPSMAASLAFIPLYILVIGLIGVPYFHRVHGFDRVTAWYAAMPGGLQDMIIFGTEAGGDPRALSLIHATRVMIIVTVAPMILTFGFGSALTNDIGAPAAEIPLHELALMAAAALIGWKGGERIGLFGASILGPMIVTAVLSLTGFIHARPPAEAILAAQFFIGVGIGVGYVGITLGELRRVVLAGVLFVLILAVLAAIFSEIVVLLGLAPPVEGFLAFAPGGQAEMTVLAIVAGADLGFVIVHHLTRVFLVITGAPLAARFLMKPRKDRP